MERSANSSETFTFTNLGITNDSFLDFFSETLHKLMSSNGPWFQSLLIIAYYVRLVSYFKNSWCFCAIYTANTPGIGGSQKLQIKSATARTNFGRMREIAHAEDMKKFNAAVDNIKQLPVWNENKPRQD